MAMTPKKAPLNKPTGEFPKSNSAVAKRIAGFQTAKLTSAESRVAAGKWRDLMAANPKANLDQMGLALGKAIKFAQKNSVAATTTAKNKKEGK